VTSRSLCKLQPVPLPRARITGGFWGERMEVNRTATIPAVYEHLKKTGRIDAFKLRWRPGMPDKPHVFWDSDVAKWVEAAAYSLIAHPEPGLRRRMDHVARLIAGAQQPDGYLNTHFTVVEPERRWTSLRDAHELYCAGHIIEAAVAHHLATRKPTLLDAARRCADYIGCVFGRGKGKLRGYPGHEEIELALVKLYRATGEERYLRLSEYFLNERGRRPHYFNREAKARGEDPRADRAGTYDYCQAHLPVREQKTAEGHAVRAMYLYCAMADLAAETGDRTLLAACKRLWRNLTERRMYVTGGVGSSSHGERFTCDYDLPNEAAYAETCAAIGLVFWAHRMLQLTADGRYADVMERALYNGVLSGVSLDGKRFFYTNPLALHPQFARFAQPHVLTQRADWFGCACCPPNITRLIASLPQYVWSEGRDAVHVHLFAEGTAEAHVRNQTVTISQATDYPWDGRVRIGVRPERAAKFTLAVRIPGWCRNARLAINGEAVPLEPIVASGYARIRRLWHPDDTLALDMPMPVERVHAHPKVGSCAGRVALQRGPVVYCLEEADNGGDLNDVVLPPDAPLRAAHEANLLGGVTILSGRARRRRPGRGGPLYSREGLATEPEPVTAVPYYAWANRRPGEMLVWIREE